MGPVSFFASNANEYAMKIMVSLGALQTVHKNLVNYVPSL